MDDCFIRRSTVQKLTALSNTTMYELITSLFAPGNFLSQFNLGHEQLAGAKATYKPG
jgi:hypothetical protein